MDWRIDACELVRDGFSIVALDEDHGIAVAFLGVWDNTLCGDEHVFCLQDVYSSAMLLNATSRLPLKKWAGVIV